MSARLSSIAALALLPGAAFAQLSLVSDTGGIDVIDGGVQTMTLESTTGQAGLYWLLGSTTGVTPGLTLPGGLNLPLNLSGFLSMTLSNPNSAVLPNSLGLLGTGSSVDVIATLAPGSPMNLIGVTGHFAAILLSDLSGEVLEVSNPVPFELYSNPGAEIFLSNPTPVEGEIVTVTATSGFTFSEDPVKYCMVAFPAGTSDAAMGGGGALVGLEVLATNGQTAEVEIPFLPAELVGVPLQIMVEEGEGIEIAAGAYTHPLLTMNGPGWLWEKPVGGGETAMLPIEVIITEAEDAPQYLFCGEQIDKTLKGSISGGQLSITLTETWVEGTKLEIQPRMWADPTTADPTCTQIRRDGLLRCITLQDSDPNTTLTYPPLTVACTLEGIIESLIQDTTGYTLGGPVIVAGQCVDNQDGTATMVFEYLFPFGTCGVNSGGLTIGVVYP